MIPRWRVEIQAGGKAYEVEVEANNALSAMIDGVLARRRLLGLQPGQDDGADRAVVQRLDSEGPAGGVG